MDNSSHGKGRLVYMNILALFDDGSRSYYQALKDVHNVISVGIRERENESNYIRLDLSKGKETYKELKKIVKIHKIDLILASPPCDSFSSATTCRSKLGNIGTAFQRFDTWRMWDMDEWKTVSYHNIAKHVDNWDEDTLAHKYKTYKHKGLLGRKIVRTLKYSLSRLGVPFLIENPRNSAMWKFMEHIGFGGYHKNTCCYNDYDGNFIQKPTIFYGTYELDLLCSYKPAPRKFKDTKASKAGEYDGGSRSDIPKALVIDIVKQVEKTNM